MLRELRRRAPLIVGPILGIALTGYFAYHLVEGERGLRAWFRLTQEIRGEKGSLESSRAEREALALRVRNLRPDHVDPDLLDERTRSGLNLVGPNDIVIMSPQTGAPPAH